MPTDPRTAGPRSRHGFTNRERPIALFDQARADLPPDGYRLLVFYGVGGQGKTALRRELTKRLADEEPRRHRFGAVDFHVETYRNPAPGLLELRRQLRESGRIRTWVFDAAIARYWALAYPGEDLNQALGDLLNDADGIRGDWAESGRDLLDAAEDVPLGVGQTVKVINRIYRWHKARGAQRVCAALTDLPNLEADQIAERLPAYLGLDLQTHRADHPEQAAPVLFLDTYEALWSDRPDKTGLAAGETDAWVRELIADAPGCLFVILGRERLCWHERYPDDGWAGLLTDQQLLGGLAETDAQRFLTAIPIPDPAIRRAIIDGATAEDDPDPTPGSTGAHPFYLDLAVNTWLDLSELGTPTPDQFGATHPEVLERFLRHRDPDELAALKVLAGPAGFDRDLFEALMARFRIGLDRTRLPELCALSIIEPGSDGRWPSMRRA